ncbi:MAG: GNAT family protein [Actinobacteria bacterium]|nr:GNAT family protein [Actinomycetota bacterium]
MEKFSTHHWPVVITFGSLELRPLRLRDRRQWNRVRNTNLQWLKPWEATLPRIPGEDHGINLPSYFHMMSTYNREGRAQRSISLAIQAYSNRGLTTQAVDLLTEYGFSSLLLHRIEINLRPENVASRKVAEKAGYRLEGERPRYLHIDGQWRDHLCFVRENPRIS